MPDQCECGAQIIFRHHVKTGKPAPIESVPSPHGNIRILPQGQYEVLSGEPLAQATEPLYINHYATCPSRGRRAR